MKIPSAAEPTDSIISRSTGTDLVDETLTDSKRVVRWPVRPMQNMHDQVKCRNIEVVHHLPLPPRSSRLELRKGFIECLRCVNSSQHVLRVQVRDQRHSSVRCGLRLFLRKTFRNTTNFLRHREQSENATKSGLVRRRSTSVTGNQRLAKALGQLPLAEFTATSL